MRTANSVGALLLFSALSAAGGGTWAEEPPCREVAVEGAGTPDEELVRAAELAGVAPLEPRLIRRGGLSVERICGTVGWSERLRGAPAAGRWWVLVPWRSSSVWNSTHPSGRNDGLLWAGRGLSTELSGGAAGRWGPFSAALVPELAWQQNAAFEVVPNVQSGRLRWADPWYLDQLDRPQRHGARPFATAALGQSYLRADALGVGAGFSTESLWLGPGTRNALLLTNEAPGFPHLFLGTSRPVDIEIGHLDVLAIWGRLGRSDYAADRRSVTFTALALVWEPRWIPGLFLGAARAYVQSLASLQDDAFLSVLEPPTKDWLPGGRDNPSDNQVAALWFRWSMPAAGFEIHGEWGRDDFPSEAENLIPAPRRTQGWVAGMHKVFVAGPRLVRIEIEAARLHDPVSASDVPSWYTHGENLSWTHRGQLLGASIGPGGVSQLVAIDLFDPGGRIGAYAERVIRNEDVFFTRFAGPRGQHDAALELGLRQLAHVGRLQLSWQVGWAYRWRRDFLRDERNLRASLQLAYPAGVDVGVATGRGTSE